MKQQELNFNICLPLNHGQKLKHIKNKSFDNHNYYLMEPYGDWIFFGDGTENNILYEEYSELYNIASYEFGHFNDDGKFVAVFGYTADRGEDALEGVDTEEVEL